jgi:hypothetical protein
MTRFRELARIEAALENRNVTDLRWALGSCKMRLSIAARKEHIKHWKRIEKKVIQALENQEKAESDASQ